MRPHIVPSLTILPIAPAPATLSRGVHSYVEQPSGETVYVAITSTGELLNGEVRRRHPVDLTESCLVRDMWRDLNRQDRPIGPPRLSLYVAGPRQLQA